ncbi:glucose-6-phosphate dehydrogenase [Atopobacter sp. AH10]|uniref:glucose-6-phosphate dehydrogenase n=1 Tax=Atopobacter sp. AH10 TaxID=2315861 RepID=UPI000EF269B1|nr:glucose-6-phosphate dehydrogenase [Atopobacter sp. AH10]RLK63254.1 glucose-6-phosphate dehydrogenase [Atopobacter sp. AH10]
MSEHHTLIVLFGATGDLASRKLYPALYNLFLKGYLNKHFAILGTARRQWSDSYFREKVVESISKEAGSQEDRKAFSEHFFYQSHDIHDESHYTILKSKVDQLDQQFSLAGNRLFYMAMAPEHFGTITYYLDHMGFTETSGYTRLIIEKPFGHDFASAKELNDQLALHFDEEEIFRIDHYLGKEMIQNIFSVRFANSIFTSLWNHHYIDHFQITLSEKIGVEERAGYYDKSGALRDMVQNHIFQILSLLAMEVPNSLSGQDIRAEKVKVLNALKLPSPEDFLKNTVRGQYEDYRKEQGVDENSQTETFVAAKLAINNFRWAGVPFYVRTGKKMAQKETTIHVVFKNVESNLFSQSQPVPNVLTIHISPYEGFTLRLNTKEEGQSTKLEESSLSSMHPDQVKTASPEAYERLIHDALIGDNTNFTHWGEVRASWLYIDALLEAWKKGNAPLYLYKDFVDGPKASQDLLKKDGRYWL